VSPAERGARRGEARSAALAAAIFVALAIATLLALFYAQELKHRPPLVLPYGPAAVTFSPRGGPVRDAHFDVRTSVGDEIVASIVSAKSGRVVRVLGAVRAHEYHHVALAWDGRASASAGAFAPPGTYLVRVHLRHYDQTVPLAVQLHLEGPAG
jgi:hypothetical protein